MKKICKRKWLEHSEQHFDERTDYPWTTLGSSDFQVWTQWPRFWIQAWRTGIYEPGSSTSSPATMKRNHVHISSSHNEKHMFTLAPAAIKIKPVHISSSHNEKKPCSHQLQPLASFDEFHLAWTIAENTCTCAQLSGTNSRIFLKAFSQFPEPLRETCSFGLTFQGSWHIPSRARSIQENPNCPGELSLWIHTSLLEPVFTRDAKM